MLCAPDSSSAVDGRASSCIGVYSDTFIGIKEATNHNDGPAVALCLASVGLPEGYNYCGAYVYHVMTTCGVNMPGPASRYAWVPSWFPLARLVPIEDAAPDDVAGYYSRPLGRLAHIGVIREVLVGYMIVNEGNTNNNGSRTGDGFYSRKRLKGQISKVARWSSVKK